MLCCIGHEQYLVDY